MGNPTSYLGRTLTWHGKQLAQIDLTVGSNQVNYSFAYDENGLRTQKEFTWLNIGTTQTVNYYYNGSVLIGMTIDANGTEKVLRFSYDASGNGVSGFDPTGQRVDFPSGLRAGVAPSGADRCRSSMPPVLRLSDHSPDGLNRLRRPAANPRRRMALAASAKS